jgi:hypothetical protein
VGVVVRFLETGLVHVLMGVLGPVVVGVGVLVLDVLVLVRGVRVGVRDFAVLVLVRMRPFVRVVVVRHVPHLLCCGVSAITCNPASVR